MTGKPAMKTAGITPWVALGAAAVLVPLGVLALRDVKANHEPALRGSSSPAWHAHIGAVHDALARADVRAAARAWHAGYPAVLENRGWESLLEAGDAYLRIGEASGTRQAVEVRVRDLSARWRGCLRCGCNNERWRPRAASTAVRRRVRAPSIDDGSPPDEV
jgi:hypothetical protein